jgi:ribonuclease HI
VWKVVWPSRCALCSQDEETIPHLFAQCPYATTTWNLVLGNLFILTTQALSYKEFFQNWGKNYRGNLRNKPGLNKLWIAMPKYICWEIWLARNKKIFQEETISPRQCAVKAISLCAEYMQHRALQQDQGLEHYEKKVNLFLKTPSLSSASKPSSTPQWAIRKTMEEFKLWMKAHRKHLLFFDGASRGNPGPAGVGGISLTLLETSWLPLPGVLEPTTNNIAEAYALYVGIRIVKEHNISHISIFGDSMLIVKAILKKQTVEKNLLNGILQRIRTIAESFGEINLFHIKRDLNPLIDLWAKTDRE